MIQKTIEIDVSPQSERMLEQLAKFGIYGATKEEVAARFVDRALVELLGNSHLKLIQTGKLRKSLTKKR